MPNWTNDDGVSVFDEEKKSREATPEARFTDELRERVEKVGMDPVPAIQTTKQLYHFLSETGLSVKTVSESWSIIFEAYLRGYEACARSRVGGDGL